MFKLEALPFFQKNGKTRTVGLKGSSSPKSLDQLALKVRLSETGRTLGLNGSPNLKPFELWGSKAWIRQTGRTVRLKGIPSLAIWQGSHV